MGFYEPLYKCVQKYTFFSLLHSSHFSYILHQGIPSPAHKKAPAIKIMIAGTISTVVPPNFLSFTVCERKSHFDDNGVTGLY